MGQNFTKCNKQSAISVKFAGSILSKM